MATTSFTRNFKVRSQDANSFVNVMTSKAEPLFKNNFHSSFVELNHNNKLVNEIKAAVKNE